MLTWSQFFEAKEKGEYEEPKDIEAEEEETGTDLDGDGEEGESAEHKKKVLGLCKSCKMAKKKCKC